MVKKKYKLYTSDSSMQIPLRTLCRWRSRGYFDEDISTPNNNFNNSDDDDDNDNNDQNSNYQLQEILNRCDTENVDGNDPNNLLSDCDSVSSENTDDENPAPLNISDEESINNDISDNDDNYNENNFDEQVDENSDDNDTIGNAYEYEMLHENSNVTTDECVLQLLDFYVKHNITKIALQQLLQMQLKILPADNQLPKTVYKLFQYAQNIAPVCRVIKHYYCRKCLFNLKSQMLNKKITFKCSICATTNSKDFSFFHEFDIGDQIRILFENYNLAEKLKKPTLQNVENISDIVDGSEYIRVNSRNQRTNFDLTLILNTDGLALVKSDKSHCWPVLFIIAELPQDIRDNYVIFAGLWYDNLIKPPMNVFLMPICLKLRKYFCKGIDWTNPKTKEIVNTKIVAPLVIADAPARAQLQNILNFNGRYGCNICEIKTVKCTKIAGKKTVRCYPFRIDSKIRTGKRMEAQAEKLRQLENKD
ncbi:uncharacterized protein LOC141537917 [Cotesia typhae]|uniref:uncharacterized protein LOC141537917 n=1 Tax=Cotesia typhae TaxID=2053667 RepID=UPI003D693C73